MADVDVQTADHRGTVTVHQGLVQCAELPVVVITSNGERDFPYGHGAARSRGGRARPAPEPDDLDLPELTAPSLYAAARQAPAASMPEIRLRHTLDPGRAIPVRVPEDKALAGGLELGRARLGNFVWITEPDYITMPCHRLGRVMHRSSLLRCR